MFQDVAFRNYASEIMHIREAKQQQPNGHKMISNLTNGCIQHYTRSLELNWNSIG